MLILVLLFLSTNAFPLDLSDIVEGEKRETIGGWEFQNEIGGVYLAVFVKEQWVMNCELLEKQDDEVLCWAHEGRYKLVSRVNFLSLHLEFERVRNGDIRIGLALPPPKYTEVLKDLENAEK